MRGSLQPDPARRYNAVSFHTVRYSSVTGAATSDPEPECLEDDSWVDRRTIKGSCRRMGLSQ